MADMIAEQTTDDAQALKGLLEYYRACGVDCAVEEAPRDRFADSARGAAKAPERIEAPPSEPKMVCAAASGTWRPARAADIWFW